jgi:uncharacterized protein
LKQSLGMGSVMDEGLLSKVLPFFDGMCRSDKPLVWVSTIGKDGRPHLVPTCFVKALEDGRIAIGCVFVMQMVANARRNPNVTLASARFTDGYDGYMLKGRAEILGEGEVFDMMKGRVLEASNGRRTIRWVLLFSIDGVYSLRPGGGRKKLG